jgi:hypothetical protein
MVLINKEKKTNFCHQNVSTTYFGDKLPLVKDKERCAIFIDSLLVL